MNHRQLSFYGIYFSVRQACDKLIVLSCLIHGIWEHSCIVLLSTPKLDAYLIYRLSFQEFQQHIFL
jgi:hypothetical protein